MKTRKRILIMPAGQFQVSAIVEAKRMGLETVAFDRNPDAEGLAYADFAEPIDPGDVDPATEAAHNHKVDAVISIANDPSVVPAAIIAKRLGLIGLHPDVALLCRNKRLTRLKLKDCLPQYCPDFRIISSVDDLGLTSELEFPIVIKPTDSNGSKGVIVVDDPENIVEGYQYAMCHSNEGLVLAEEHLSGNEVSIETITFDGDTHILSVTDKITTPPPYCAEIGHTVPSSLAQTDLEALKTCAVEIINAFGIDHGPAHVEIFITDKGPKLVEIGARMGGGCITSHLVPLATGINMTKAVIDVALGETPNIEQLKHGASAIRFITPREGRINAIKGLDDVRKIPGVVEVFCSIKPGDEVQTIANSDHRTGHVITAGDTISEASNIAERALSIVEFL